MSGNPTGEVSIEAGSTVQVGPDGATLNVDGTGLQSRGATWTGGTLLNQKQLGLASHGFHNRFGTLPFTNEGTVKLQDNLEFLFDFLATNRGTWEVQDNASLTGSGRLLNEGTLYKTGTGTASIAVPVDNTGGRVEVALGTLSFELFTRYHSGAVNVVSGNASVRYRAYAFEQGSIVAGNGSLLAALAGQNDGVVSPGLSPGVLTWIGPYNPSPLASLHVEVGG